MDTGLAFSPLLALVHLRRLAEPTLTPIDLVFDHHEAIRAGHVPPKGMRLTLHVNSRRALDATIVKSDTAKLTVRWGDGVGEVRSQLSCHVALTRTSGLAVGGGGARHWAHGRPRRPS